MKEDSLLRSVPVYSVERMLGHLLSAKEDLERGLLREVEFTIAAATFSDFLLHAESFHQDGKKGEAAVLASAVLEDTVKKIAARHALAANGKKLEELIEALVNEDVWTLVRAQRVRSYAAVRNQAFHAQWDKFELRDVEQDL